MFEQVFRTNLCLNHRPLNLYQILELQKKARLCWTKYKGYAYDVDYRDPKFCSIKSDASYDPTPIDNAMYICTD